MEIPRFSVFFLCFSMFLLVKSEIPIFLDNPKEKLQQLVEQVELKVTSLDVFRSLGHFLGQI